MHSATAKSRVPEPLPRSTPRAKYIEACAAKAWALHLWRKAERPSPNNRKILRYRCRSWRHEGACANWRSANDYERIKVALAPVPLEHVMFLVLTFPERAPGKRAREAAYKAIWRRWQSLRQAISRGATLRGRRRDGSRYALPLWGKGRVAYVATVEQHRKDGWPHLNVILVGEDVAHAFTRRRGYSIRWLKSHAKRCHWGWKAIWAAPARDKNELAGYVLKVAGRELAAEVTKLDQVPLAAPHRFRRIRYGPIARNGAPGFLAVREKDLAWTGQLERLSLAELADRLAHWDAVNARAGWSEAPEDERLTEFFDPAHRPRGPPVTFFASLSPALRVRYWTLRRQLGLSPVPRFRKPPGLPWPRPVEDYE